MNAPKEILEVDPMSIWDKAGKHLIGANNPAEKALEIVRSDTLTEGENAFLVSAGVEYLAKKAAKKGDYFRG